MQDYNKDYTALLLNCYVKKEKYKEIEFYIKEATDEKMKNSRIFDVATAIEVCREHKQTRQQAVTLAEKEKQYELLVQIYIDDLDKFNEAINTIEKNILNLRQKVDILKVYGPKILKNSEMRLTSGLTANRYQESGSDRVVKLVQGVASDVIKIACDKPVNEAIRYKAGQNHVKIEELL